MCELQSYCEIQLESALGYSPVGLHRQQLFIFASFHAHYVCLDWEELCSLAQKCSKALQGREGIRHTQALPENHGPQGIS